MSVMNTLKINGKKHTFTGQFPATIKELLAELQIGEAAVIAEIDGKIIRREGFSKSSIYPGQSIELVHFIGGG